MDFLADKVAAVPDFAEEEAAPSKKQRQDATAITKLFCLLKLSAIARLSCAVLQARFGPSKQFFWLTTVRHYQSAL